MEQKLLCEYFCVNHSLDPSMDVMCSMVGIGLQNWTATSTVIEFVLFCSSSPTFYKN